MSYEEVTSFDNLYKSLKTCCRNIRWKDSTVGYESNILKNTYRLRQSLLNDKYKIDNYQYFTIYEPKKRDIVATRLKDRQFQRSLCDNSFYETITHSFISDNGACQKGKGVDYTLDRITAHLRRYYNKYGSDGWVLKCDIHHYFQSIQHDVAYNSIVNRIKDERIKIRVKEIIDSFGDCGLGLGSQVSQLIALAVLDGLDHHIKENLHVKHYVRYMDDFILISNDKGYLKQCLNSIKDYLDNIGLSLNNKTVIHPLSQGIKFLQWRFILTPSGKIIRKMNKSKLGKQRRKMKKLYAKEVRGEVEPGTTHESLVSFMANAKRGDTFLQRKNMVQFYYKLGGTNNGQHLQTT